MLDSIKTFLKEEDGGIAENTALVVMILIIVVGVITALAPKIKAAQEQSGTQLDKAADFDYENPTY